MKKILLQSLLLLITINVTAQTSRVDGIKKQLTKTQPDSSKFKILKSLTDYYQDSKQDSLLFYAKQELVLGERMNDTKAIAFAYVNIGVHEYIAGNYPLALQMMFKSLQLAESINDSSLMEYASERIGNTYKEYDAPDKAKQYYLQSKIIAVRLHNDDGIFFSNTNLGYEYAVLNELDSAMLCEQQAYMFAIKKHSDESGWVLLYFADIQLKLHNKSLALDYYNMSITSIKKTYGDSRVLSKGYLALAGLYNKYDLKDSAVYFAQLSMKIAQELPYLKGISNAGRFLASIYDSLHRTDSAFFYQKIFISTNDTLNSRNRTSSVENLTFLEQIRQQEKEQALQDAKEEQKQNIEYALIALGIITFIILYLLLSRSIVANERMIEFFGVVALLIVFEFLNLVLHTFLERLTNHSPLLMLLALVCIAALLVPLHNRLEKWATRRLVEKNKEIRLAAAKKTIEKLEKEKAD